ASNFGVATNSKVTAGIANGSMTVGLNAGFNPALAANTILGVSAVNSLSTGTSLTAIGYRVMENGNTINQCVGIGFLAMRGAGAGNSDSGSVGIGNEALTANSTGSLNT